MRNMVPYSAIISVGSLANKNYSKFPTLLVFGVTFLREIESYTRSGSGLICLSSNKFLSLIPSCHFLLPKKSLRLRMKIIYWQAACSQAEISLSGELSAGARGFVQL